MKSRGYHNFMTYKLENQESWSSPIIFLSALTLFFTGAVVLSLCSMGIIVLELYWKHAPKTCKNFAELARRGYYNGTKFHRIIKDFMIQGGDPTGTGRGGASIYGKQFEDELHPDLKFTGAGILAMANAGPDTNGSQFFVTLAPTQWLDGKHTIFGRVCQGIGMVNRVGMVETNSQDRPVDDVKIIKAYPSG
ncbi:PREDICTED: peptidyl-prolyl cis-trans isomerase-like 1 isoform X1 [Colobus angolensis palliatus]|uniref:peptidyl-prolyl cis-trans isomerase-like 1 isoform X1 n=1 Tax=Colobus angolensis palliatus TaxID=336983 RepID=UPI0005F52B44|nr:PREDICTED: peptidyl-prolyl cis-trans isomerase-like 1 isoform X1 [Colobus angolensis palliatus]